MKSPLAPTPIIYLIVVLLSPSTLLHSFFVPSERNRLSRYHPFVVLLRGFPLFCQLRDGGSKLRSLPHGPPPRFCFRPPETFSRNECSTTGNGRTLNLDSHNGSRSPCSRVESMTVPCFYDSIVAILYLPAAYLRYTNIFNIRARAL